MMADTSTNDNIAFEYIDTSQALARLTKALPTADWIAFDTEADSFHHYRPKVCLMQLTLDGQNYIVDPLTKMDLTDFLAQMSRTNLIIHDAGYDLRLMHNDFDFKPEAEVFDTMLAASLAGLKNVGLSSLLSRLFDKNAAKHNQKADWSRRPLSTSRLQYAAEDTVYLAAIKDFLQKRLNELGRVDWYIETCQWAIRSVYIPRETADPKREWRIKGTGKCSPKEMAFLKHLWYWRENIAEQTNIAPFMICRNEEMLKLTNWAAHRRKPIEPQTRLPIRCQNKYKRSLIAALRKAQELPEDQWPGKVKSDRSKRLSKSIRSVIDELKAECEKLANELDLSPQLLASRSSLTRIVVNQATTLEEIQDQQILMNWQAELLLPSIKKVLAPQ